MTQVGKMLMDEGRQEEAKKNARNMLKRGGFFRRNRGGLRTSGGNYPVMESESLRNGMRYPPSIIKRVSGSPT